MSEDLFHQDALWESERVKFYEFGHRYLLDEKTQLIGVTSLMKKHGLSPDYSGIDEATLMHAAELGTQAHKRIEDYCEGRAVADCRLIKTFRALGLNIVRCEYLVTDEQTTASSVDLLNEASKDEYDLIDMKRTSTIHRGALAWQLGIYKYLFLLNNPGKKVRKCFCLPIKKGNKNDINADSCGALVEIEPVSEKEVKALLKAERDGKIYKGKIDTSDSLVSYSDMQTAVECARKLEDLMKTVDAITEMYDEVKGRIYETMLANNVDTIDREGLTITLKRPFTRNSIDSKKLAAELPDVYDKYAKTIEVKGNVTIKLK